MAILGLLPGLVMLGVAIYLVTLQMRLVKAVEWIAHNSGPQAEARSGNIEQPSQ